MDETRSLARAGSDHPGMHLALGLTRADGRKHLRERFIEKVGGLLLLRYLRFAS